jgi:hypothetical protein
MGAETRVKRTVVFVDGQNLYHSARETFGYSYPDFDLLALARAVCTARGWQLAGVRFYTRVPETRDDAFWHGFWNHKLAMMGRQGVRTYSRSLRYRNRRVLLPDGGGHTYLAGEEKGIDLPVLRVLFHESPHLCVRRDHA